MGLVVVAICNGVVLALVGAPPDDAIARTGRPARVPAPRPGDPAVVLLYGDSLAWEAQDHFVAAFADRPDVRVITRTFGGTAICDWLPAMRDDAAMLAPRAVVIEFSGNAWTACMADPNGEPLRGDAWLERYRRDISEAVEVFAPTGARVYVVGAPRRRPSGATAIDDHARLHDVYRRVADADASRAEFVDAGAAVLADRRWTATLPCLPVEPCEGGVDAVGRPVNVVRAPDGTHFCPVGRDAIDGVTGLCPVWSSGAYRFGVAMARPVLADLPDPST